MNIRSFIIVIITICVFLGANAAIRWYVNQEEVKTERKNNWGVINTYFTQTDSIINDMKYNLNSGNPDDLKDLMRKKTDLYTMSVPMEVSGYHTNLVAIYNDSIGALVELQLKAKGDNDRLQTELSFSERITDARLEINRLAYRKQELVQKYIFTDN